MNTKVSHNIYIDVTQKLT